MREKLNRNYDPMSHNSIKNRDRPTQIMKIKIFQEDGGDKEPKEEDK